MGRVVVRGRVPQPLEGHTALENGDLCKVKVTNTTQVLFFLTTPSLKGVRDGFPSVLPRDE